MDWICWLLEVEIWETHLELLELEILEAHLELLELKNYRLQQGLVEPEKLDHWSIAGATVLGGLMNWS